MTTIQLNTEHAEDQTEAADRPLVFTVLGTDDSGGALIGFDTLDLVGLEVHFPRLPAAISACPLTQEELSGFLEAEISQNGPITRLRFVRTALVFGERYWVWEGIEPASGCRGYATVSVGTSIEIGFDVNWEDLTLDQFIVGVHNGII